MKKILHISKFYYPYYGGIEDVAHTLVTELSPYFEQRIICFNHERGTICNVNGSDVLRVGTMFTIASQPFSINYRKILKKEIERFRPDYIHLHLPNPLVATYILSVNLYGAKIISHWHADVLGQKTIYCFYKRYERKLLERSHKIIFTSPMYGDFSKPLRDFQNNRVVLPNTINEKKFKLYEGENVEIQKIKEKYNNKKIIFFVGRHVGYKGIELLIESEKYIKEDCVILIAGTGQLTLKLKELAKGSDRIKFIGRLSNPELKYHFYASTVFAFPSINRREAFGVALAEALYCGLPAVSFNIQGSGAVWVNKHNYSGIVVDEMKPEKYAEALDRILSSDELRAEFSENAKQWVRQNFLKEQIVSKISEIYD